MTIRQARPDDHTALVILWRRAGLTPDIGDDLASFAWAVTHFGAHYWVLTDDAGRILGSVLAAFDGRRGWIHHLAVDPVHQRQGFGKRLMARAEQSLRDAGCPKINLLIEPRNRGVQVFYEGLGFQAASNLFMEKVLAPLGPMQNFPSTGGHDGARNAGSGSAPEPPD